MNYKRIIFSGHAIRQMFHRDIKNADVLEVIRNGKMINEYPDDKPYPSFLMLGFINNRPIHVVLASDNENQVGIVITVYEPDPEIWTEDFVSRRNKL